MIGHVLPDDQASLTKSYVTTRGRETVAWAREVCGGNGIVLDHDVVRFFNDAEALYAISCAVVRSRMRRRMSIGH